MHRPALTLALAAALVSACAGIARADFMTTAGGYGPFPPTDPNNVPSWGAVQAWSSTGAGEEYIGGMFGAFATVYPTPGMIWFARSPQYTGAYACMNPSCTTSIRLTSDFQNLHATPAYLIITYLPPCPVTSGFTVVHYCTGSYTPIQAMGPVSYPTFVVGDGIPTGCPGPNCLPYGAPLKLVAPHPMQVHVECEANLKDFGLASVDTWGAAVYACP